MDREGEMAESQERDVKREESPNGPTEGASVGETQAGTPEADPKEAQVEDSGKEAAEASESLREEPGQLEIVAIPYINDGAAGTKFFLGSMFMQESEYDSPASEKAEKYFFGKFESDDEPKWDGVLVCSWSRKLGKLVDDRRNSLVSARDFKSAWLRRGPGAMNNVTFNVKCTMPRLWAHHFQSFLCRMEEYGENGVAGQLSFGVRGDLGFRPKFSFGTVFEKVDGYRGDAVAEKADELFSAV